MKDIVKKQYSDQSVIKSYTTIGLWRSEEELIDKYIKEGSSILDIGCGAGRTSIHLSKKGYKVKGIDLIPGMIKTAIAQAEYHGSDMDFEVMDAVNMDFPPESYQNIFFLFNGFEQIQGLQNRTKIVKDVWKILKPGGYFIVTTRSGLAIGRRTVGWFFMATKYLYMRYIMGNKSLEFGDKIWKNHYHHYINPFKLKEFFHDIGFEMIYFNSHRNIENQIKPSFFTHFSNDKALFYVLRKRGT